MNALAAVIVDDEPLSRRAMRQLLDARSDIIVLAECANSASALEIVHKADVVFLDVQMPEMSGLQFARMLAAPGPPYVVFVTAYDEYAVPAFETEALDFLPKPVSAERLEKAIVRVRARLQQWRAVPSETPPPADIGHLTSRVGDREELVAIREIDCIEGEGVYASVRVGTRRYLVRYTLDALERLLVPKGFLRVHRSWMVPVDRIILSRPASHPGQRELLLRSGTVVPISRRRQPAVMAALRGAL